MPKKNIYFDEYCGYSTAAVVEGGKITEFNFEKRDDISIVGNIYKGRVETVLNGIRAAFINCGLERSCYLSCEDALPDRLKYDGAVGAAPAFPELKEGDEIAVQVVKPPVGKKGARVTASTAYIGKHQIYMPKTPFVGVSRKICDGELRKNLIYSAKKTISPDEGLILRTAAPYAKRNQLELELNYLRNLNSGVERAFKTAKVGDLLYTDLQLPIRIMRDTLACEIEKIIVGTEKLEKVMRELIELFPPSYRCPVILHNSGRDMLDEYGLSEQIFEIASPKVALGNGAYLVIERTEALTVVDVNTGKFTGTDSLEQTVYYTNILAAREIARQVRLRNIGGIIVVDFIDMQSAAHNKSLVEELERALKSDSSKCKVSPMSEFGLVEFTRKRQGASPLSLMTKPCKHCNTGFVKSSRFTLLGLRAKLLNMYADGERLIRIDMNSALLTELCEWSELCDDLSARLTGAEVYGIPHKSYTEGHINYRCKQVTVPDNAIRII